MTERVTYEPKDVVVTFTNKNGREHVMRGFDDPGELYESHPGTCPVRVELALASPSDDYFKRTLEELRRRVLERTPMPVVLSVPPRHSKSLIIADAIITSLDERGRMLLRGRVHDTDFTRWIFRNTSRKRELRRARMRRKKRRGWA